MKPVLVLGQLAAHAPIAPRTVELQFAPITDDWEADAGAYSAIIVIDDQSGDAIQCLIRALSFRQQYGDLRVGALTLLEAPAGGTDVTDRSRVKVGSAGEGLRFEYQVV